MVVLPLSKLGVLAVKQASKPVANLMKRGAQNNQYVRRFALIYPAQIYHRWEQIVRMKLLGFTGKLSVKPLTEDAAVQLGADMLGEFIVFSIAAGILYFEIRRGQNKEQRKEDEQNAKLLALQNQITTLSLEIEKQNTQIRQFSRQQGALKLTEPAKV